LAEWSDYLGIHMADGNEPFGQEVLQEIAGIAGVADDIDAVERLRAALVPMGSEYRRIIAMVPSELKGAPGHESHSERLEWLDTPILNPLKRLYRPWLRIAVTCFLCGLRMSARLIFLIGICWQQPRIS